jgi:uncharacterized integral membrane protein
MPWRLIILIIMLAVLLGFIGLNLGNTCNISLGFKTFYRVPVYLTIFVAFILGMVSSLPFIIFGSLKKSQKKENPPKIPESPNLPGFTESPDPAPKGIKGFFKRKSDSSKAEKS